MVQIKNEEEIQSSKNTGICFVVFKDGEMAKKALQTSWL